MGAFIVRYKRNAVSNAACHFAIFVTRKLVIATGDVQTGIGAKVVFAVIAIIALLFFIREIITAEGAINSAIEDAIRCAITGFPIGIIDDVIPASRSIGAVGITCSIRTIVDAIITFFVSINFAIAALTSARTIFYCTGIRMAELARFRSYR